MGHQFYTGDAETDMNKYEFGNFQGKTQVYQEPHQLLLRNWVSEHTLADSVLLYHGLGTGKTCSVISIAEGLKEYLASVSKRVMVITSETLLGNFQNELLSRCTDYISGDDATVYAKRSRGTERDIAELKEKNAARAEYKKVYEFQTYDKLVRDEKSGAIKNFSDRVVVIDEVHNIVSSEHGNPGPVYESVLKLLKKSYNYRLVLLSATPITDSCTQIVYISNLLNANDAEKRLFPQEVTETRNNRDLKINDKLSEFNETGLLALRVSLKNKVSFMSPDKYNFPQVFDIGEPLTRREGSTLVIKCEMSMFQFRHYRRAFELDNKRFYLKASDASNVVYPDGTYGKNATPQPDDALVFGRDHLAKYSAKLKELLGRLDGSTGTSFVFTKRTTGGGASIIVKALKANGYVEFDKSSIIRTSTPKFASLTGAVTVTEREQVRKIFNSEANIDGSIIKVLVGSEVMSEGITFKCVRHVHVFEPHWNFTSIDQAIGRAVRNGSHARLPLEDRNVRVYRYMTVGPRDLVTQDFFYIEHEKYILSETKDRINRGVFRLLKEISIDCSQNKNVYDEYISGKADFSKECDYQSCQFTCDVVPSNVEDKSTYNLDIRFFDKFDITLVSKVVVELFKVYSVWDFTDIYKQCTSQLGNVSKEAVETHLSDIVKNRVQFTDAHNRKGVIIQRTTFYIFNPIGKDLDSSVFAKTLDFSKAEEYTQVPPKKVTFESKKEVSEVSEVSQKVSELTLDVPLSAEDKRYNENVQKNRIFGTRRKHGKTDGVFRLVNLNFKEKRELKNRDKRLDSEGQDVRTLVIPLLQQTCDSLGIPWEKSFQKKDYARVIIAYLTEHGLVLR